ncbi:uncharacterized protein [Battus philenor]|uniref:uncharacterized protein n=1 Tax=Battus philenor TaxID=42288 RepID=UPI0035D0E250
MSTEERLNSVLRKLVKKFKLKNYQLKRHSLDETIENYFGILIKITIIEKNRDDDLYKNLIVKLAPNIKELRDFDVLDVLYGAEIFFYNDLLPRYKELYKFDLSQLFPDCYYLDSTRNNEVLVLKDMCYEGFSRHRGDRFLDREHVVVSLKSLAQFHALSIIMDNNNDISNRNVLKPYSSNYPKLLMLTLRDSLKNNLDIFTDNKHKDFFSTMLNNFDEIVNNASKTNCLVYGHGDFWKENILYKYKDTKPVKACILDFQTTRLLCPAQDLLSFLITSTEAKLRRECYEYFLSTYYEYLCQTLVDHLLPSKCIYSRRDLDQDLQKVAPYCFITANMAFSLWLGLEEKTIVQSKNISAQVNQKNASKLFYKQIMLDIIEDFITFKYHVS